MSYASPFFFSENPVCTSIPPFHPLPRFRARGYIFCAISCRERSVRQPTTTFFSLPALGARITRSRPPNLFGTFQRIPFPSPPPELLLPSSPSTFPGSDGRPSIILHSLNFLSTILRCPSLGATFLERTDFFSIMSYPLPPPGLASGPMNCPSARRRAVLCSFFS